ncbi:MAG: hypothetical protein WCO00_18345 [Rhodospirillaceae bacterium]
MSSLHSDAAFATTEANAAADRASADDAAEAAKRAASLRNPAPSNSSRVTATTIAAFR